MNDVAVNIAFIGCGNMATSLVKGLLQSSYPAEKIWVTARNLARLQTMGAELGINIGENNLAVVAKVNVLILCVKPHQIKAVCAELTSALQVYQPLVISVAAGISMQSLRAWIGASIPVFRAMPNIPCAIGAGVTALLADCEASDQQKQSVASLFNRLGLVSFANDERLFNVMTAFSGSGPAYVFLFMEALQQAVINLGMDAQQANQMTKQLVWGAAKMAFSDEQAIADLRKQVTSPGGSTEQAIREFQANGLQDIVAGAIKAACHRVNEIMRTS